MRSLSTTRAFIALLAFVSLSLTSCSSGSQHALPSGTATNLNQQSQGTVTRRSNVTGAEIPSQTPNLFAAAQGQTLTDTQVDAYIDPTVTGADRTLAHTLMNSMPSNKRGDFIYMDPNGRLVSNNPKLLTFANVKFDKAQLAKATQSATSKSLGVVSGSAKMRRDDFSSQCSPANPPGVVGGAYIRNVSLCTFAAGWAFINVDCGTTYLQAGESGNAYFELTGSQQNHVEGGITTVPNTTDSNGQPVSDGTVYQGYLRSTAISNGGYETLNDNNNHYTCGQNLAIWHGVTLQQSGTQQYVFTAVGNIPDSIQPETSWTSYQQVSLSNAAYLFGNMPSDMNSPGTDLSNSPTPCRYCSVAEVTTIAQNGAPSGQYSPDGSYFGVQNGQYNGVHWMEVTFGDWASNCQYGTSQCSFYGSTNPAVYEGGYQFYPSESVAQYSGDSYGDYTYETDDGIALPGGADSQSQRGPVSQLVEPLGPQSTPAPTAAPTPTKTAKPVQCKTACP